MNSSSVGERVMINDIYEPAFAELLEGETGSEFDLIADASSPNQLVALAQSPLVLIAACGIVASSMLGIFLVALAIAGSANQPSANFTRPIPSEPNLTLESETGIVGGTVNPNDANGSVFMVDGEVLNLPH